MKGSSQSTPRSTESPRQDKPKEEQIETHSKQTDKKIEIKYKKQQGKNKSNIHRNAHQAIS